MRKNPLFLALRTAITAEKATAANTAKLSLTDIAQKLNLDEKNLSVDFGNNMKAVLGRELQAVEDEKTRQTIIGKLTPAELAWLRERAVI